MSNDMHIINHSIKKSTKIRQFIANANTGNNVLLTWSSVYNVRYIIEIKNRNC